MRRTTRQGCNDLHVDVASDKVPTSGSIRVEAWPAEANRAANPYNALLTAAVRAEGVDVAEFEPGWRPTGRADIVHVHWPEAYLNEPSTFVAGRRTVKLLVRLARDRRRGARIVWTAHNLRSHARTHKFIEPIFWTCFRHLLDGWISLSEDGAAAVESQSRRLSKLPHAVIPHGHYTPAYPPAPSKEAARRELGISPDVVLVLSIGRVKRYKGLTEAVRAFRGAECPDARYVIAGACVDSTLDEELRREAAQDDRVQLDLRSLEPDHVSLLLAASDLVIAPYVDVLNSGTALLALSFGRRVVVPTQPTLRELQDIVGSDWVIRYQPPIDARTFEKLVQLASTPCGGRPDLSTFDWQPIGSSTITFYRRVLA